MFVVFAAFVVLWIIITLVRLRRGVVYSGRGWSIVPWLVLNTLLSSGGRSGGGGFSGGGGVLRWGWVLGWGWGLWRRRRGGQLVSMKPRDLFKQIDHDQIVEAIRRAESQTTGEIRVFISHGKPRDSVAAARAEFLRLKMHHAAARNGVLIFIAPRSRGLAIVGDTAIHERRGDNQWRQIAHGMLAHCPRWQVHPKH